MPRTHRSPIIAASASAAVGVTMLLTACGSDAEPDDVDAPADSAAAVDDAATDGDTAASAEQEASTGGGIDGLESDALPDGVAPAAAGTAYIEIEGERLEFTGLECSFTDEEDAEAVNFTVEGQTAYGLTELWVSRVIGWGAGFDYEEELVQVSLLDGEFAEISMAQNSGDEDGGIEWHRGDGPDPLLAVVGSDVMATGTLEGHPGSENPQAGAFVMAANCG